jgi:hypothetical protein
VVDRWDAEPPESQEGYVLRKSAELTGAVLDLPAYRLAIKDVSKAIRERSDDAFVYAYRAVEDVARAVSGGVEPPWPALHDHLGTDEEAFKARVRGLRRARDEVAHGNDRAPDLVSAREKRNELTNEARRIVQEAMVADDRIPIDDAWAASLEEPS